MEEGVCGRFYRDWRGCRFRQRSEAPGGGCVHQWGKIWPRDYCKVVGRIPWISGESDARKTDLVTWAHMALTQRNTARIGRAWSATARASRAGEEDSPWCSGVVGRRLVRVGSAVKGNPHPSAAILACMHGVDGGYGWHTEWSLGGPAVTGRMKL